MRVLQGSGCQEIMQGRGTFQQVQQDDEGIVVPLASNSRSWVRVSGKHVMEGPEK